MEGVRGSAVVGGAAVSLIGNEIVDVASIVGKVVCDSVRRWMGCRDIVGSALLGGRDEGKVRRSFGRWGLVAAWSALRVGQCGRWSLVAARGAVRVDGQYGRWSRVATGDGNIDVESTGRKGSHM
jgi:hypothetical protein